jgi:hypothetical protein
LILALTAAVLPMLGARVVRCIDDNRRTADRDLAAPLLSESVVEDFNMLGGAR